VASYINDLIDKDFSFINEFSSVPDLGYKILAKHRMGCCKNSSDYIVYIMRALGIPAGSDFVKQWGNRSGSHTWNFIIDEQGKNWAFDGMYTNVGVEYIHREHSKKARVYRHTYKLQNTEHLNKKKTVIIDFFNNKNYKDVSSKYWKSRSFTIKAGLNNKEQIAHLCVFNNREWVPVQISTLKNHQYEFDNVEPGVLFLPCLYKNNEFIPFAPPFIIMNDNSIKKLFPQKDTIISMTLYRKYPINQFQTNAIRVINGIFEGSNNINFNNPDTLGTIDSISDNNLYNMIPLNTNKKYRFIRYKGAKVSYGSMTELIFYSKKEITKRKNYRLSCI